MRVSVLMTSYRHERYIERALEGVLAQQGVDFELLVGDDASPDGTRTVIERYARSHPDLIQPFLPERNRGNGGKTIFGELIERSQGDYLAMLDGDDYWTAPDKLASQVAYLDEHRDCSMCFHDVFCVYEDEPRADERYNGTDEPADVGLNALFDRCVVASCSPLFRREAIAPLPDWYFDLPWGDWSLYFMAAERGRLHYLPETMGVYRIHAGGMYRGLSRLEALEQRTDFYAGLGVSPEHEPARRHKLAQTWVKRALEHNRLGQRAAAVRCLARGVRVSPLSAPAALLGRAGTSRSGLR